jgi:acyl-coenzyme A synthetase/AMP-(fatty) acid ligase
MANRAEKTAIIWRERWEKSRQYYRQLLEETSPLCNALKNWV